MEDSFRFKSKQALYPISIISLAATVISILALEQTISADSFVWQDFITRALYSIVFITLILYALKIDKGSKTFFQTLLVAYGALLAFTGFIFPYHYGGIVAEKLVAAISLSMFGGLFVFNYNWRFIKKATGIIVLIALADTALSVWYLCIGAASFSSEYAFLNVCQVLLRPVAAILIAASYFVRMREKLAE